MSAEMDEVKTVQGHGTKHSFGVAQPLTLG